MTTSILTLRRYHARHRELEAVLRLTPRVYAGALADDAEAGAIRRGLVGLSDATLQFLDKHAAEQDAFPAAVLRQAIAWEQARRRVFPAPIRRVA